MRKNVVIGIIALILFIVLTALGVTGRLFMIIVGIAFGLFMFYLFEIFIAKKHPDKAKDNAVGAANKMVGAVANIAKASVNKASEMYDNIISDSEEDLYEEEYDNNVSKPNFNQRNQERVTRRNEIQEKDVNKPTEDGEDEEEKLTFVQWEEERAKIEKLYSDRIASPKKKVKLKKYKDHMDVEEPSLKKENLIEVAHDPEDNTIKVYGKGLLIEIQDGKLKIYTDGEQDINNMVATNISLSVGGETKEIEAVGMDEIEIDNQQDEEVAIESTEINFEKVVSELNDNGIAWV